MCRTHEKVGIGGNFLAEEHTVKHFRNVVWLPKLMKRYSTGPRNEALRDAVRNAIDRVQDILRDREPYRLSPKQESGIERIVAAADARHTAR